MESETSNNSDSPQTRLNNLSNWLALPETQRQLQTLEQEAQGLQEIVLETIPRGHDETLLREQSIGELRGLRRLSKLTSIELADLREQLKSL